MLTIEERRQLRNLLEMLDKEEQISSKQNVSNRSRDEKGRFLPKKGLLLEESPSRSARKIKLVKVKGTYGSYLVRTKWMNDGEKGLLLIAGTIILLSIIF